MPRRSITAVASAFVALAVLSGAAFGQSTLREGKDAFGSWQLDKPGTIRLIRPQDLPEPGATRSAANTSRIVAKPSGAAPQVPPGFKIELVAEGLNGPRIIRVAPNGDIFVAEPMEGASASFVAPTVPRN